MIEKMWIGFKTKFQMSIMTSISLISWLKEIQDITVRTLWSQMRTLPLCTLYPRNGRNHGLEPHGPADGKNQQADGDKNILGDQPKQLAETNSFKK